MVHFIQSLTQKRITELKILKTNAQYLNTIEQVASSNNYLNSYYQESGFLGVGRKNFAGNSIALQELMNHLNSSLQTVEITARLKELDAEVITMSLANSTFQLSCLKLEYICLNPNSVKHLSLFLTRSKNLKKLKLCHTAESLKYSSELSA